MTYITEKNKNKVDTLLNDLTKTLNSLDGKEVDEVLSYSISKILCEGGLRPKGEWNYPNKVRLIGLLETTKQEFYDRVVAQYRNKEIEEKGDLEFYNLDKTLREKREVLAVVFNTYARMTMAILKNENQFVSTDANCLAVVDKSFVLKIDAALQANNVDVEELTRDIYTRTRQLAKSNEQLLKIEDFDNKVQEVFEDISININEYIGG